MGNPHEQERVLEPKTHYGILCLILRRQPDRFRPTNWDRLTSRVNQLSSGVTEHTQSIFEQWSPRKSCIVNYLIWQSRGVPSFTLSAHRHRHETKALHLGGGVMFQTAGCVWVRGGTLGWLRYSGLFFALLFYL